MPAFEYCVISMSLMHPRKAKSRGTPSKIVFFLCQKEHLYLIGAFTRFVTIFDLTDRTIGTLARCSVGGDQKAGKNQAEILQRIEQRLHDRKYVPRGGRHRSNQGAYITRHQ